MPKFLKQIKMNNFRAYYDTTFNFEIKPNKKLNVIFGTNDDGKTTFLNALRYTLYGEEEVSNSKDINNKKEIKNLSNLDKKTKVVLDLVDESTKKITRITRDEGKLSIFVGQDSKEGTGIINKLLPLPVKDLFIFEGEKSKDQITDSLKSTIEEVSGLKNIIVAKEILNNLGKRYLSEEKKLNYKNEEKKNLIETIEKNDDMITKIKGQIQLNNSRVQNCNKELSEVKKRLEENNEKRVRDLQEKKELYEKQKGQLEEIRDQNIKNIKNIFINDISNWIIYECMGEYENLIKELRKKGLIPTPFSTKEIKKLKKDKFCICGNPIAEKEVQELNKIIERNKKAPKNSEQLPIVGSLVLLEKDDLKNLKDKLDYELKGLAKNEDKLMKCQSELNNTQRFLEGLKGEDVERDVARQADLEDKLRALESDITLDKTDLLKEETLRKLNQDKLDSYPATNKEEMKIKEIRNKINLYIGKLDKIYNTFMEKMKREILHKIREVFKKIFSKSKKEIYFNFDFGDNFELQVKTSEGIPISVGTLGTGVKKSVGIATTLALSEIYGFEFPMVLDAPFTELDRPQKEELLDVLIKISKKRQVIMLVLKEDLEDKHVFPIIKANSSSLSEISNSNNKNISVEEIK